MAPIIKVSDSVLEGLAKLGTKYEIVDKPAVTPRTQISGLIYIPSLKLYVSAEKVGFGKNWDVSHGVAEKYGGRMLPMLGFNKSLAYLKEKNSALYKEITEVRSPWRAEWIDAKFSKENGLWKMHYSHVLDKNGNPIAQKSEDLDEDTLMEDRTHGISIEDWLENPTKQGFPRKNVKEGNLYYLAPRDGAVTWFNAGDDWAYLNCSWDPSYGYSDLGVRVAKQHK